MLLSLVWFGLVGNEMKLKEIKGNVWFGKGKERFGLIRKGWIGLVWFGLVWLERERKGKERLEVGWGWFGLVWKGKERNGKERKRFGLVWFGLVGLVWKWKERLGWLVWLGKERKGKEGLKGKVCFERKGKYPSVSIARGQSEKEMCADCLCLACWCRRVCCPRAQTEEDLSERSEVRKC